MAKVLVLYYSAYGHIETMAEAIAEGARETGAEVDIKRVPELVPAAGAVEVNGVRLGHRDGAAITDEAVLIVTALEDAEVVLVDAA